MGHSTPDAQMDGRVNTRAPQWIEDAIEEIANGSTWANESQVARDMLEMGIILHNAVENGIDFDASSLTSWTRPQGNFPNDAGLLCTECGNSNKYLFRHRSHPVPEANIDAIECLSCNNFDDVDAFDITLHENQYWARSGPHPECHIVDEDARRTLCNRYNTVGLDTRGTPSRDGTPTHVCTDCVVEFV